MDSYCKESTQHNTQQKGCSHYQGQVIIPVVTKLPPIEKLTREIQIVDIVDNEGAEKKDNMKESEEKKEDTNKRW